MHPQTEPPVPPAAGNPRHVWFRRVVFGFFAMAALAMASHFALLFYAENEFSSVESIVAIQSAMLARDGTLYYDLNHYPYTVCAYTPIFYLLEAGMHKFGLSTVLAGRLVSLLALLSILLLVWRLLILYTGARNYAWTGVLLVASTANLLNFGTTGQVDVLAVCFALAAFYQYSRHSLQGEKTLIVVGVFAGLAFFTKQTMIACPAAVFVLLWLRGRKRALQWGGITAGCIVAVSVVINTISHGRFVSNTVMANFNPFALWKLTRHAEYFAVAAGQLLLITVCSLKTVRERRDPALFVYLGAAFLVLAVTAPKIGSDSNYHIETVILLAICACEGLYALKFFDLTFQGSKSWITLLQIPLAIHLILNFRMTKEILLTRIANEATFRTQVAALQPFLTGNGRVLSDDVNSLERIRGKIEVEPLIYTLLVRAGAVNPQPVTRDISAGAFSTIVTFEDLNRRDPAIGAEISKLPEEQIEAVRKHYKLVAFIPGGYLNGVYIYQPASQNPTVARPEPRPELSSTQREHR